MSNDKMTCPFEQESVYKDFKFFLKGHKSKLKVASFIIGFGFGLLVLSFFLGIFTLISLVENKAFYFNVFQMFGLFISVLVSGGLLFGFGLPNNL